jgi:hypothetical protein
MTPWPESTYKSNPDATHSVHTGGGEVLYGWYTNEFEAWQVAKKLKEYGYINVQVKPYTPVAMSYDMKDLFS